MFCIVQSYCSRHVWYRTVVLLLSCLVSDHASRHVRPQQYSMTQTAKTLCLLPDSGMSWYRASPATTYYLPLLGLATLGLATLGLATLGLATLGLATLGLATLGLATLGRSNLSTCAIWGCWECQAVVALAPGTIGGPARFVPGSSRPADQPPAPGRTHQIFSHTVSSTTWPHFCAQNT